MLTLYGKGGRTFRVLWMLEELGIEYEPVLVDIRDPNRQDSGEFREASPMGKVPRRRRGRYRRVS